MLQCVLPLHWMHASCLRLTGLLLQAPGTHSACCLCWCHISARPEACAPPCCRSLGCLDPQCVLCEHNPHRRCNVNFAPKYLVNDILKAKCDAPIRVEIIDRATGIPLGEDIKDVQLEVRQRLGRLAIVAVQVVVPALRQRSAARGGAGPGLECWQAMVACIPSGRTPQALREGLIASGRTAAPVPASELTQMLNSGQVSKATFVWCQLLLSVSQLPRPGAAAAIALCTALQPSQAHPGWRQALPGTQSMYMASILCTCACADVHPGRQCLRCQMLGSWLGA